MALSGLRQRTRFLCRRFLEGVEAQPGNPSLRFALSETIQGIVCVWAGLME